MNKLFSTTIFISIAFILFPTNVKAQLIPDNTLNNENSRVVPVSPNRDNISGGAARGANLFHSFQEFNINLGREVYFNNPVGIENILTRVTGANPSNIFGTLGVSGNANLFLINPNGIIFGNGAKLDLNGAFYASTAAEIKLGNNGNFSATNPNNNNLLSIKPSALFFNALANHQSQITVRGNLETRQGQTIGLLGGNIAIDGGQLSTPSGQIFLGAIDSGTVNLDINNNTIDYSGVNLFKDIQITAMARVRADTADLNGKGIDIAANNLLVNGGSQISVNTSGTGNGGRINIAARNIEISGFFKSINPNNGNEDIERSQITANVAENAIGNGGSIEINTNNLRLLNSAQINVDTESIDANGAIDTRGNGGNINIKANNLVEISGFAERLLANGNIRRQDSRIQADVREGATGNGGNININTSNLQVLNRGDISAETDGVGNAGNILITANNIEISGNAVNIQADARAAATGAGGNINLNTGTLSVLNGGDITAETDGAGNGGNIFINAKDIEVSGENSQIEVDVDENATGNGGIININTNRLKILNDGQIRASTLGAGNAGNISIAATELVEISGVNSEIFASVGDGDNRGIATGNGGNIKINTNNLRVLNAGNIKSETYAIGNAGNIDITANNLVEVSGFFIRDNGRIARSQIEADVQSGGTGNGGTININTGTFRVLNRGEIRARTFEAGNGGNIIINGNSVEIGTQGEIVADVGAPPQLEIGQVRNDRATGNGGNITIKTDSLRIFDRGEIKTETYAVGKGGNIDITANAILLTNPLSRIATNVDSQARGNGGTINIRSNRLNISDRASIEANILGAGNPANESITIDSNFVNIDNSKISALTETAQNGGNITLNIDTLLSLRNGSTINTESISPQLEAGSGGNITIANQPYIVAFPRDNEIVTRAISGDGGNISIDARAIFGFPQFLTIDASSQLQIDGNINIDTFDTSPDSILRSLESTPVDVAAVVASDLCRLEDGKLARGSSFIITGKGGLSPTPSTPVSSYKNLLDWTKISSENSSFQNKKNEPVVINNNLQKSETTSFIAAKGWIKRADGSIVLTANPISSNPVNYNLNHPNCANE